jgi:hypothetical protein
MIAEFDRITILGRMREDDPTPNEEAVGSTH